MICALFSLCSGLRKYLSKDQTFKSPTSNPSSCEFYDRNIPKAFDRELSSRNSQVLWRYSKTHETKKHAHHSNAQETSLKFVVIAKSGIFLKNNWMENMNVFCIITVSRNAMYISISIILRFIWWNSSGVSWFSAATPLQLNVACCLSLAPPLSISPSSQSNE